MTIAGTRYAVEMIHPIMLGAINIMDKIEQPPSKTNAPEQKKPFSMGLPPLARQPFLQPKPLWEKVPVAPAAAKAAKPGSAKAGSAKVGRKG